MASYLNTECPYCNKLTKATDDIVVCPECGTPHHHNCYFEHGECFNTSLHGSGFEFIPVEREPDPELILCSNCGGSIPGNSAYCNYCGIRIPSPGSSVPDLLFGVSPLEQSERTDLDEKIDDIPIRHWITFIGKNYNYYVNRFKFQDSLSRKGSFTFSALVFPSLFFLYRRVWGAAIISGVMNFVLSLPSIMVMYFVPLGINLGISAVALEKVSEITGIISVVFNMFWGIFAVWLYRKRSSAKISKLKDRCSSDSEFNFKLQQTSGPSIIAPIIGGTVFTVLMVVLWAIIGFFEFFKHF